jgi:GNAT superfamily N-acetyltransferase
MIRAATVDDAASIAAVHVHSWRAIYRGHFPDQFLAGLSAERRAAGWTQWLADPAQSTAVYETAAGVLGFANVGPSRDADASPLTGELMTVYVAPHLWRRGIGTELMAWATGQAAARRWTAMTLWVLEGNGVARAFYEHCGWAADGATKREPFGGLVVNEVRYAWRAPMRSL